MSLCSEGMGTPACLMSCLPLGPVPGQPGCDSSPPSPQPCCPCSQSLWRKLALVTPGLLAEVLAPCSVLGLQVPFQDCRAPEGLLLLCACTESSLSHSGGTRGRIQFCKYTQSFWHPKDVVASWTAICYRFLGCVE